MRVTNLLAVPLALLAIGAGPDVGAAAPAAGKVSFVTLGTNSGPIPNARRAEPANLLRAGGHDILVDVGDGAAWQLAKAGVGLDHVHEILISHLHFDHTGGLYALLSQRYQSLVTGPVTIYGPPGTRQVVDGLVAAMVASTQGPMYARARLQGGPGDAIKVVEIGDGATFAIGDVHVTAASNSHFSIPPGSPDATKFVSLSYRFDMQGRSIVYTGDTGPSANVERLAAGADLLLCEIMDPDAALARLKADHPGMPDAIWAMVSRHFHDEHMSPLEVGKLAGRAGVKALVLTHDALEPSAIPAARRIIAGTYKGSIRFAADLDVF